MLRSRIRPRAPWTGPTLYAWTFLINGLIFGILQGLVYQSAGRGVFSGVLFGLFMSATLGTFASRRQRHSGGPVPSRQDLTFSLDTDLTQTRQQAREVLESLPAQIRHASADEPIQARTPTSWQSWGERISIDLRTIGEHTEVVVRSRPIPRWARFDLGNGTRNVQQIADAMQRRESAP